VPVLYTYLDNLPRWWRRKFGTAEPNPALSQA
jgi:hypothetical protein